VSRSQPSEDQPHVNNFLRIQSVPKKTTLLHNKINLLVLFREIIAVYSGNRTKCINTLRGQNAKLFIVNASCTCNYHQPVNPTMNNATHRLLFQLGRSLVSY
jgi:hypothetical protein